jgi:virginiamycin B lyase
LTGRRLIGRAVATLASLLLASGEASAARTAALGSITEVPVGVRAHSYLFGLTTGPDRTVWLADLSCTGLGRCGIDRLDRRGQVREYRRGLDAGSVPFTITAATTATSGSPTRASGRRSAIGHVTSAGRITERTRGLAPSSSPVAIAAAPDGSMWFTDEGVKPAVGRATLAGSVRELSHGLLAGSLPADSALGPDGRMWFTDEGATTALGTVTTGVLG